MRRCGSSFPSVIVLLAVLLVPSVGPLADHHFAERDPGHHHVGASVTHSHGYDHAHSEGRHAPGDAEPDGGSTALLSRDGGPSGTYTPGDLTGLGSLPGLEPAGVPGFLIDPSRPATGRSPMPPDRPPQPAV